MNMIVNKSDLVGYEAVDRTTAKKEALAKLVAAWESKQAKKAARFGGLGFLAVSLAACNSSTDDPVVDTGGATEETNLVTAHTATLATTTDYITSDFTDQDDTITADATQLTAGDVLVDSTTTDNDTLNVTLAGGTNGANVVGTISGIENVNFDNTSLTTDSAINIDNIIGASVTVNHSANPLVAPTGSAITNLDSGSSLTFGTNITGTVTATTTASATGASVNGGSATTLTVTSGATNTNLSVTGGSTAGSTIVDVNSGTTPSVTSGASDATLTVTNIAASATLVASLAGTATAASTVNISGAGTAAGDAASLAASGIITLLTNGTGNALDQIEALTVSGNGAAVTFNDSGAPTSLTMTGSQDITYVTTAARADAMTAITNSTTGGTQTIEVGAPGGATDFSTIAADVININGAVASGAQLFLDGANVKFGAAQGNAFSIDISDGSGTTTQAAGSLNLDLAADTTGTVTIDKTAATDNLTTLNVTASAAQTALAITDGGGAVVTVNVSGSAGVTTHATNMKAAHLNGASMTGALDATLNADLLTITGGSGNDTFRGVAADGKYVLAGGAGNDQFITAATSKNMSIVATGIEVIDVTAGTADFAGSQLHEGTFIIKDTGGGSAMQIDDATALDISTLDLSGLSFQNAATTMVVNATTALNGASFLPATAVTITGSANADTITGTANADTLGGGGGADTLNGAAGADNIDGGAGVDTITGGAGADTITTGAGADIVSVAAGDASAGVDATTASTVGFDTVTDFTVGTVASGGDQIDDAGGVCTIAANVATTATAGLASIAGGLASFHADDDTLAEQILAAEAAMANAAAREAVMFQSGSDAYVLISAADGLSANDSLIKLTGIDTTATTSDVLTLDTGNLIIT